MQIQLNFLGTSASNPTKDRNLSAMALSFDGKILLFDCPEGTQRQLMKSKVSYMQINYILISHFHADHILGLPGLIATMSMHGRTEPLHVFGPKGIQEQIDKVLNLAFMKKSFEIVCRELRSGKIFDEKNFSIFATALKHEIPCYGFVFKEKDKSGEFQRKKALEFGIPEGPLWRKLQEGESIKFLEKTFKPEQVMDYSKGRIGRKISYVVDTMPDEKYFDEIMDSDILIHEATFMEEHLQRARETKHSTAKQAAIVAQKTNAKLLILTHFSPRHKDAEKIENEARMEFAKVKTAYDLMEEKL